MLVDYVCDARKNFKFTTYDPVCEFPWVNKNWMGPINATTDSAFDDVVFDDCSQLYHVGTEGHYDRKCVIHTIIAMGPFWPSLFFLHVYEITRRESRKTKKERVSSSSYPPPPPPPPSPSSPPSLLFPTNKLNTNNTTQRNTTRTRTELAVPEKLPYKKTKPE